MIANGTSRSAVYAATATASTGHISGWKMKRVRNGRNRMTHDCSGCDYMKSLEDNSGRTIYFCMFDQSPFYSAETGICGGCELDDYAEEIYRRSEEWEENDG